MKIEELPEVARHALELAKRILTMKETVNVFVFAHEGPEGGKLHVLTNRGQLEELVVILLASRQRPPAVSFWSEGWNSMIGPAPQGLSNEQMKEWGQKRDKELREKYGPSFANWPAEFRREVLQLVHITKEYEILVVTPFSRNTGALVFEEPDILDTRHGGVLGGSVFEALRILVGKKA